MVFTSWPDLHLRYVFQICPVLALAFHTVFSLLLEDNICIAETPCTCIANVVNCHGLSLKGVPSFVEIPGHTESVLYIYLYSNSITQITANSFHQLVNVTDVRISLQNNEVTIIDNDAFAGIAQVTTYLDLERNNLMIIPEAFGKLTNLQYLYLRQNPLISLATPALPSLSRTLRMFTISMDHFSDWPPEFQYFQRLSQLYVDGYQQTHFPLDAFSGLLQDSLIELELSWTKLDRIPQAVCHLRNLQSLRYISNPRTTYPMFESCSRDMTSLKTLVLRNNTLDYFPELFESFVNLTAVDLSENNIRTIDSKNIPHGLPLQSLFLYKNKIPRIPSAINRFEKLQYLNLHHNDITSIEDTDLHDLPNLRFLYMQKNPLEYVLDNAFKIQSSFTDLYFSFTNLDKIPKAIAHLTEVHLLDFRGTPIDCSCDMSYLKDSTVTFDTLLGTCMGTGENLTYYLESYLPLCS